MARKLVVEIVGDASSLERSYKSAERGTRRFGQSMEKAGRGAVVASVGFRGLGRSVAFASSAFLGGAGLSAAITSTVKAAEESQRVLGQTRNAVQRSGLSWAEYGAHIKAASLATAQLSGFDDEQLLGTFSNLVRRTGDVNRALQLNALAANVARGRNIGLEAAQALVLKASIGNVGALRRLGINIDKNATATQALDLLNRKYAGSAAAYGRTAAGAQDRFRVSLQNLQEAVGAQLLPSITRYLNKGADWLNQSKNQQRVVRDVHDAVVLVTGALKGLKTALDTVNTVTGSTKNTLKLLLGAFVAFKTLKLVARFAELSGSIRGVGAAAAGSTGKVTGLRGALGTLPELVAITLAVDLVMSAHTTQTGLHRYSGSQGWANLYHDLGHPLRLFQNLTGGGGPPPGLFVPGKGLGPAYGPQRPGAAAAGFGLTQTAQAAVAAATAGIRAHTLTPAQIRAIALAGDPNLAALRAQQAYDRRALAFLEQRRQAGKISAKNYTDEYVSLTDDLAQQTSAINSILADRARKARDAAARRKAAAKKAADAAKKALTATADSVSAFAQTLEPGFTATLKAADAARKAAAKAIADAAARAKQFTVPLGLQLAQARAAATPGGADDLAVQRRIKQAALRALKSGRLAIQGQIDAWNAIASANDALNASLSSFGPTGRVASAEALTSGIRFASVAARRRQEARIAQALAHGGHLPGGISVQGQPIEVHTHVELDGREVARTVTRHQQQQVRHRAIQTSGPHAGRALQ